MGLGAGFSDDLKKMQLTSTSQLLNPILDIAVIDIYVDQNCILWVKFENKGKTKINTTLHFKLWINDTLVRDENMLFDELDAGKWRAHGYTGATPIRIVRASQVKAFVDTRDQLKEANEVNNTLIKHLPACQIRNSIVQ
jgi:hypothetical protein